MDKIAPVLAGIEKEAAKGTRFLPIVGPHKGKFYYLAARAARAKRVLELGALVGYSALLFSRAVGRGGRVVTVEREPGLAAEARANFRKAGAKNITLIGGDARDVLKKLAAAKERFDVVFLDIEKDEYVEVFDDCVRLLRKNGLVLTDNALWDTKDLRDFRKFLGSYEKADTVFVPIEDGIAMSVRR
jgi:predicted O-methyltransferase YrrM